MTLLQQFEMAFLMLLAALLSALIGLERERRDKSAGLRTHMIVGIGACLVSIISKYAFPGSDPSRVAANIITSVSFLGAGVIIRRGDRVHDLTTAASIWVASVIGMTVGAGAWFIAIIGTLLLWFTLVIIFKVEVRVLKTKEMQEQQDEDHIT